MRIEEEAQWITVHWGALCRNTIDVFSSLHVFSQLSTFIQLSYHVCIQHTMVSFFAWEDEGFFDS